MKPNFALDLTFDGITLLHRAGEAGWHVVGDVTLDSPDLSRDLAALRKKANTLDPSGMHTKLIIPDEQIRYLDIPAASAPRGDHAAAAADALEGATPYALDELAYDWTVRGTRLYVAAVARETLHEAAAFAREHTFNPVCFVADSDQALFPGVPFFGVTEEAGDTDSVERGSGPMKRLGLPPDPGAEQDKTVPDDPSAEGAPSETRQAEAEPALSFASVRAERGLPPRAAPRLDGVARITPDPLPDAQARALTGAAQDSLAPRKDTGSTTSKTAAAGGAPTSPKAPRRDRQQAAPQAAKPDTGGPVAPRATTPAGESNAAARPPSDEAERLTIFGARNTSGTRRGKPRFLGLILTAALLVLLVAVAAWTAIFPDSGVGRLLRGAEPQVAVTPDIPELGEAEPQPPTEPAEVAPPAPVEAGRDAPDPNPAIDTPESAALPETQEQASGPAENVTTERPEGWTAPSTPEEARRRYAATGIWPYAPSAPGEPRSGSLDTFYQTSIDELVNLTDAVALPRAGGLAPDPVPRRPALPPPPGRTFDIDDRGFVRATPQGALTPEGVLVRSGPPPVRPPETPPRAVPLPGLTPTEEALEARENLSDIRPRSRPETLIEEHERGAFGGRTRTELATLRPRTRPAEIAARAEAEVVAASVAAATDEAVAESLKPRLRPQEIARTATPRRAATAAPAIPTSASIARRATERNAINLRQVNLIGVYGAPSDRRALVRLSNGRYRKVQVGDRIDGGRVSAIGDTELRYTKSGRSVVLRMPRG